MKEVRRKILWDQRRDVLGPVRHGVGIGSDFAE